MFENIRPSVIYEVIRKSIVQKNNALSETKIFGALMW